MDLPADRWFSEADDVERRLLDDLADPVLDVGCGPGRIVAALAQSGRPALGVDVAADAVESAQRHGGVVLQRSVFSPLPGEGRWASVVLFDGNVGIGGEPTRLLVRVLELLAPDGVALIEVEAPGTATDRVQVRIEHELGSGPWFAWARVSADGIDDHLRAAGLRVLGREQHGERWFVLAGRA